MEPPAPALPHRAARQPIRRLPPAPRSPRGQPAAQEMPPPASPARGPCCSPWGSRDRRRTAEPGPWPPLLPSPPEPLEPLATLATQGFVPMSPLLRSGRSRPALWVPSRLFCPQHPALGGAWSVRTPRLFGERRRRASGPQWDCPQVSGLQPADGDRHAGPSLLAGERQYRQRSSVVGTGVWEVEQGIRPCFSRCHRRGVG